MLGGAEEEWGEGARGRGAVGEEVLQKEAAVLRRHRGPTPDTRIREHAGGGRMGVVGVCWRSHRRWEAGGGGPSAWPTGGQVALG